MVFVAIVYPTVSVSCIFEGVSNGKIRMISCIYGPNDDSFRPALWAELSSIRQLSDSPGL